MNKKAPVDAQSLPSLASHVRLQFDNARQVWTIQAPERAFLLDESAYAVISRCDGKENLSAVIDALCAIYESGRETVEPDVIELIQDFVDKGVLTL